MGLIAILFYILTVAAQWVVFQKAGIAGWKSIIPIYNSYCLFKIAWGNGWIFLATIIPLVGVIVDFMCMYKLAKSFDKAKSKYIVEPDRKKAVQLAVRMAREGDMIVLAGKGHETYQLIKGVKVPFSEREIVKEEARKILESRKDEIMIAN